MSIKTFAAGNRIALFLFFILISLMGCGDSRELTEDQLDSTIMLVESQGGAPQDWMTLREWKEKLVSEPRIVEVVDHFSPDGKNFGLQIEIQDGNEDLVFMFEQIEGKLHLSHVGGEYSVIRVKSGPAKFLGAAMVKGTVPAKT